MDPIQKRCFTASAALHGGLLLALAVSSAFYSRPKPPLNLPPLRFVPTRLVDQLVAPGGGGNPQGTPSHAPPKNAGITAAPQPRPAPKRRTKTRRPPEPKPNIADDLTEDFDSAEATAAKEAPAPKRHLKNSGEIVISLKEVKRRPSRTRRSAADRASSESSAQARREQAARLAKLEAIAEGLESGLTSGLSLEPLGPGGAAYAYYGQEVMRLYEEAWQPNGDFPNNPPVVKVKIRVRRDGSIIREEFLDKSGIPRLDRSVSEALDRVRARKLPPFPDDSKDDEKEFILNFNLSTKQQNG